MRTTKVICFGCAAISLLVIFRLIGEPRSNKLPKPYVFVVENGYTNDIDTMKLEPYKPTAVPTNGQTFTKEIVTIKYDLRGTNEMNMIDRMNMTLLELGLEKDKATVQRLVQARVSADWSKVPDHFKTAPDWAALQAVKLKQKISRALGTTDALTIQRLIETDLGGITAPPMADFEVRQGSDSVWREAEAIKQKSL